MDLFSENIHENEDPIDSCFKESDDSSSDGNPKDPDMSTVKSIKSKQMRSVLKTLEEAKKKVVNMEFEHSNTVPIVLTTIRDT